MIHHHHKPPGHGVLEHSLMDCFLVLFLELNQFINLRIISTLVKSKAVFPFGRDYSVVLPPSISDSKYIVFSKNLWYSSPNILKTQSAPLRHSIYEYLEASNYICMYVVLHVEFSERSYSQKNFTSSIHQSQTAVSIIQRNSCKFLK